MRSFRPAVRTSRPREFRRIPLFHTSRVGPKAPRADPERNAGGTARTGRARSCRFQGGMGGTGWTLRPRTAPAGSSDHTTMDAETGIETGMWWVALEQGRPRKMHARICEGQSRMAEWLDHVLAMPILACGDPAPSMGWRRTTPAGSSSFDSQDDASQVVADMRKPRHQRSNAKHRKVQAAPPGIDVRRVARSSRYVGSPYHKGTRSFAGAVPDPRPDASLCPRDLARRPGLIQAWLRAGIRNGHTGAWQKGYPKYVWYRHNGTVYEARQGSPGSGEYHGYPLQPGEMVRGLP